MRGMNSKYFEIKGDKLKEENQESNDYEWIFQVKKQHATKRHVYFSSS